jgi:hypothetical protein
VIEVDEVMGLKYFVGTNVICSIREKSMHIKQFLIFILTITLLTACAPAKQIANAITCCNFHCRSHSYSRKYSHPRSTISN